MRVVYDRDEPWLAEPGDESAEAVENADAVESAGASEIVVSDARPRAAAVPRRSGPLRDEITARNHARSIDWEHSTTKSTGGAVIYQAQPDGRHGNFFPASYRRILANPEWSRRLRKTYTASRHLPHSLERTRGELECACSSDALLMNIFCHPRTLASNGLRALLQSDAAATPQFGVRVRVPLSGGYADRTEVDMQLGDLLVEAKLSEGGFQEARPALVERYPAFADTFFVDDLPRGPRGFQCYQLLRGILAAQHTDGRFALFCDARRSDLVEDWFSVLRTVQSYHLRHRLLLVTWQELAACLPKTLQQFLLSKYGIAPARSR